MLLTQGGGLPVGVCLSAARGGGGGAGGAAGPPCQKVLHRLQAGGQQHPYTVPPGEGNLFFFRDDYFSPLGKIFCF